MQAVVLFQWQTSWLPRA